MAKKIINWLVFSILFIVVSGLMIFYLDLANGPFYLLIIEIGLIIFLLVSRILSFKKNFIKRFFFWLIFIVCNVIIVLMAKPKEVRFKAVQGKDLKETDVLTLKNGDIKGLYNEDKTVEVYAGIPYAKAPVGNLRWKEPQDVDNWEGVKDCTTFQSKSMQPKTNSVMDSLVDIYASGGWHPNFKSEDIEQRSEDSLYLNIWRPSGNKTNLPILVFIHGGSLTSGSSSFSDYNGETLAKNDVIMITITYRLGIFGYLALEELQNESINHTTGNYGLLDQIKALEWVNENANYFGGDKNNITIAGESAGSSSISALCTSPLAKGLFKRAIGESSSLVVSKPPHTYRTMDDALQMGKDILKEFKVTTIEELRKIPAEKLVKTKYTNSSMTLDGYALTKNPYQVYKDKENNEESLLNGYNVKEADAFVIPSFLLSPTNKKNIQERLTKYFNEDIAKKICELYKDEIDKDAFSAFNEIISVYWFIYPHHSWSQMALESGVNVYRYQFTKENGYYGTYHSGEMIYFYGNIDKSKHSYAYDDSDKELSKTIVNYIVNYVKTGNPNGEGLATWSEYISNGKVMELGTNVGAIDDKYLKLYEIIAEYLNTLEE